MTDGPTLGVIGLGLIGGSIALGWLSDQPGRVVAWTRSPSTREQAAERGVSVAGSIPEVVDGADVVVLATSLPALADTLAQVSEAVATRAHPPVITDVGSVKAPIHERAQHLLPEPSIFVPGHPMAGTEQAGWAHADPALFRDRVWALVVDEPVAIEHWLCVAEVALRLGSVVLPVAAVEHDRAVALTSHLPHLVAAGLQAMLDAEPTRLTATLVAGSFSSATRVVRGAGRLLGAEMAWANRRATVARIEQLVDELGRQRALLLAAEPEPIDELFGGDGADATRGEDGPVAATRPELLALGRRGGLVTGIDVASGTVAGLA